MENLGQPAVKLIINSDGTALRVLVKGSSVDVEIQGNKVILKEIIMDILKESGGIPY